MIKNFNSWLCESRETGYIEEEYKGEEWELIIFANDEEKIDRHLWLNIFTDYDDIFWFLTPKGNNTIRSEYASGKYEWIILEYKAIYNREDHSYSIASGTDQKQFNDLKAKGWKIRTYNLDNDTFIYLMQKEADPKRFSTEIKNYIKNKNVSSVLSTKLIKLMNSHDYQEIRGIITGSKFGI